MFCLLAGGLLIPIVFLVSNAFESLAIEREHRHRVVAERVMDELERTLSEFLRSEEERPYAHYRYFYASEADANEIRPSPLTGEPTEPFIMGYFQVEPDGEVSTPEVAIQKSSSDHESTPTVVTGGNRRIAKVRQVVTQLWRPGEGDLAMAQKETSATPSQQRPGTAIRLKGGGDPTDDNYLLEVVEQVTESVGAYESIQQLNSGLASRKKRAVKVAPSQARNVQNFVNRELSKSEDDQMLADRQTAKPASGRRDAQSSSSASPSWRGAERVEVDEAEASFVDKRQQHQSGAKKDIFIEVRQEPMVGRSVDDATLVLYRTVLVAEQAYRQGLLIDASRLVKWLSARVLRAGELDNQVQLFLETNPVVGREGDFLYRYRFADPFGSLTTVMQLQRLPDSGSTQYLYLLCAVVVIAASIGLFALYRMVAVVVSFAERRNNFVSAVTHELKTPLTAIRMYAEMLRDGLVPNDERKQKYYGLMTTESERLTRLLNNVLELSQLENNTRSLDIVGGDLSQELREVVALLRPHVEQAGFRLILGATTEQPAIALFDRDALKQILFNLVDNSLKYAKGAENKEILLGCHQLSEGMGVTVTDHGPGMAKKHLVRAFEPFYRAENEMTRSSKGTGIGLALVKGLAERMGGKVWGRNDEPQGFEVTILLPPVHP